MGTLSKQQRILLLVTSSIVFGIAIGFVIDFYGNKQPIVNKQPIQYKSEPLGYFSPDGKFHTE